MQVNISNQSNIMMDSRMNLYKMRAKGGKRYDPGCYHCNICTDVEIFIGATFLIPASEAESCRNDSWQPQQVLHHPSAAVMLSEAIAKKK